MDTDNFLWPLESAAQGSRTAFTYARIRPFPYAIDRARDGCRPDLLVSIDLDSFRFRHQYVLYIEVIAGRVAIGRRGESYSITVH